LVHFLNLICAFGMPKMRIRLHIAQDIEPNLFQITGFDEISFQKLIAALKGN